MKLMLMAVGIGLAYGQSFTAQQLAQYCTGIQYGPTQQPDLSMIMPPYNTLIYGKQFRCDIPVSCSLCNVTLGFLENRSVPALIGVGKRLFTVGFQGGNSEVLDLFATVGPRTPWMRTWIVPVYDKVLHLTFNATLLNALVSIVTVVPAPMVSPCGTIPICAFVSQEIPSGKLDGINTVFMLIAVPHLRTEHVFLNGLLQLPGIDYTIVMNVITFTKAPQAADVIKVDYEA